MEGSSVTLQSFVANIKKKIPGKTLAMAVVELEKYFRLDFFVVDIYGFFSLFLN